MASYLERQAHIVYPDMDADSTNTAVWFCANERSKKFKVRDI